MKSSMSIAVVVLMLVAFLPADVVRAANEPPTPRAKDVALINPFGSTLDPIGNQVISSAMNNRGMAVFTILDNQGKTKLFSADPNGVTRELLPGAHSGYEVIVYRGGADRPNIGITDDGFAFVTGRKSGDEGVNRIFAVNIASGEVFDHLVSGPRIPNDTGESPGIIRGPIRNLVVNQFGTFAYSTSETLTDAISGNDVFKGHFNSNFGFNGASAVDVPHSPTYRTSAFTMQIDAIDDLYFGAYDSIVLPGHAEFFSKSRGVLFRETNQAFGSSFFVGLPGILYISYTGDIQNQRTNAGIYRINGRLDSDELFKAFRYSDDNLYKSGFTTASFQVASDFTLQKERMVYNAVKQPASIPLTNGIYQGQKPESRFIQTGDNITIKNDSTPRKVIQVQALNTSTSGATLFVLTVEGYSGQFLAIASGGGCDASAGIKYMNQRNGPWGGGYTSTDPVHHPERYFRQPAIGPKTIQKVGCPVITAMMLLSKFIPEPYSSDENQAKELQQMRDYAYPTSGSDILDHVNNDFMWPGLPRYFNSNLKSRFSSYTGGDLEFISNYSDDMITDLTYDERVQLVKNYVCNGMPMVLHVPGGDPDYGHFVLAVGTKFVNKDPNGLPLVQPKEVVTTLDVGKQDRHDLNNSIQHNQIDGLRPFRNNPLFGSLPRQRQIKIAVTGEVVLTINNPLRQDKVSGQYGSFIYHDDSEFPVDLAPEPEDRIQNFYNNEPIAGSYGVQAVAKTDTPYTISISEVSIEGVETVIGFSSGRLAAGESFDKNFEITASSPYAGSLASNVVLKYNANFSTDYIDYNGTLNAAVNSDGRNVATEGAEIIVPDAGITLSLPGSSFQRISGGYQYKVDVPVTNYRLIKIMDNGTFRVRLSNIDLTGRSLENLTPFTVKIGNDVFTGAPNRMPIAIITGSTSGHVGQSVSLDGSYSYDLDGNSISYSWELLSKPIGSQVLLTSSQGQASSFTTDIPGYYVAKLTVSDGVYSSVPVLATFRASKIGDDPNTPGADNGFVRLTSDKMEYSVGEVANFQLNVSVPLAGGSENEYYFAAFLNDTIIPLTKVSATLYTATTSPLTDAGSNLFKVSLYLQNKAQAAQLVNSITFYNAEIVKIDAELAKETNGAKRQELEDKKASYLTQITKANEQLDLNRTKVADDAVLSFQVNSAK